MTIRRLFIANRGEIALRILRSARRLGITTILGASEADLRTLPARLADEVVRIGPAPPAESYLSIPAQIEAARRARADALHPGYGFLSENPAFAEACEAAGIRFIGPTSEQLAAFGDKLTAREMARRAGVPVLPGGGFADIGEALAQARAMVLPVLVKAAAGGGGRGMRRVDREEELEPAIALAMAEARAAFGDPRVYLERFVARGRHIEVQILGDGRDVWLFGDRDCSIQRRYQKLIEEAPAPFLPERVRTAMGECARALASGLRYKSAGTVEFVYDMETENFYFLEMNARLQVEHPVTEMITGHDLVAHQIRVAEGARLGLPARIPPRGHAIECRINAEDWEQDFRPAPGRIDEARFAVGTGLRLESHVTDGTVVPPYYDSMIAKLIAWGETREAARQRLVKALAVSRIEGVASTLGLHRRLLDDPEFVEGGVDTGFLARRLARWAAGRDEGGDDA